MGMVEMTTIKLSMGEAEQVTVSYLEQLHHDLKSELEEHEREPYLEQLDAIDITRSVIAIEIIMKDLLFDEDYLLWKMRHGVELLH
jgi:hypothetical protein|tara:strand:- start:4451 stop:4708 length:258 start_codon:yes stop_codon:yes gene_type:complete